MTTEKQALEDQRGNLIAKAVWKWIQEQRTLQYVPWVLQKESVGYDPIKVAKQEEHNELLADLEHCIQDTLASMQ